MNIPEKNKLDIQCFVYFLFKGTIDPRLIGTDYVERLLNRKDLLYNCFEVFAYAAQDTKQSKPARLVADYILAVHAGDNEALEIAETAKRFNKNSIIFWKDFLILSKWFCYNSFPDPLNEDYLKSLDGCGSDAVPIFAVWTNVVEIDDTLKVTNSETALSRANEKIKSWDKEPATKFEEWELKQEIY